MSKEINRIAIDIETTGTKPGCHVLSIGAVYFDLENGVSTDPSKQFYEAIFYEQRFNIANNLDTMDWWRKPENIAAREAAFAGTDIPRNVLGRFINFILKAKDNGAERQFFSRHSQFDFPILEDYAERFFLDIGIEHREINCSFTLANQIKRIPEPPFKGIRHHALDDAIHEAEHCVQLLRFLN